MLEKLLTFFILIILLIGLYIGIPKLVNYIQESYTEEEVLPEIAPIMPTQPSEWGGRPTVPTSVGDRDMPKLEDHEVSDIINNSKAFLLDFNFVRAEEYIVSLIKNRNLEDSTAYQGELKPYRGDLAILSQLKTLEMYEDYQGMIDIVKYAQHPITKLVGALWLIPDDRAYVISDSSSLNPIFGQINSIGEVKLLRDAAPGYTYWDEHYSVEFEVDNYKLVAHFVRTDVDLKLLSIKDVEGETSGYPTVREYIEIMEGFDKYIEGGEVENEN